MNVRRFLKSALSLVLVLAMLVGYVPLAAYAAAGDSFQWGGGSAVTHAGSDPIYDLFFDYNTRNEGVNEASWSISVSGSAETHNLSAKNSYALTMMVGFSAVAKRDVRVEIGMTMNTAKSYSAGIYRKAAGTFETYCGGMPSNPTQMLTSAKNAAGTPGSGTVTQTVDLKAGDVIYIANKAGTDETTTSSVTLKVLTSYGTYTAVSADENMGTVAMTHNGSQVSDPNTGVAVVENEKVVVTATPKAGYDFWYWEDNAQQLYYDNPYTVPTATAKDTKLTAVFKEAEKEKHTVTLYVADTAGGTAGVVYGGKTYSGNTTRDSGAGTSFEVTDGDTIQLKMQFNPGYKSANWEMYTPNGTKTTGIDGNTYTVTQDLELVAKFLKESYSFTATAGTGGTVYGVTDTSGLYGKEITVIASPDSGYEFIGWYDSKGNKVFTEKNYTHILTGNIDLEARFQIKQETGETDKITITFLYEPAEVTSITVDGATVNSFEVDLSTQSNKTFTVRGYYNSTHYNYASDPTTYQDTSLKYYIGDTEMSTSWGAFNFNASTLGITADTVIIVRATSPKDESILVPNDSTKGSVTAVSADAVTLENGTLTAKANTTVTLTAEPQAGYDFVRWEYNGTVIGTELSLTFRMDQYATRHYDEDYNDVWDSTITAVWAEKLPDAAFTVTPADGGTIQYNGETVTENKDVSIFGSQTLTFVATPAQGYKFVNWVDGDGKQLSTSATWSPALSIVNGKTITAVFEYTQVTIQLPAVANGTYSIDGQTGSFTGEKGMRYTVTAVPNDRYKVVAWNVNGVEKKSSDTTYVIEALSGDTKVFPVFGEKYVTVTLNPVEGGKYTISNTENNSTVTVKEAKVTFDALRDVVYTLTATPDYVYNFSEWQDGTGRVITGGTFTFTDGSTVAPVFVSKAIRQVMPGVENGSYTIKEDGESNARAEVFASTATFLGRTDKKYTLTAKAANNYHFVRWVDQDGVEKGTDPVYTGYVLSEETSIYPVFAKNRVAQTFPAVLGGSYTITGDGKTYAVTDEAVTVSGLYNTEYTISIASMEEGYEFRRWVDEKDTLITTASTYSFTLDSNKVIKPLFYYTLKATTLNPVTVGSGSFQLLEDGSVKASSGSEAVTVGREDGKVYKLKAIAGSGYRFAYWESAGKVLSRDEVYEGDMPKEITAVFVPADCAVYSVDMILYDFLDDAIAAASNTVYKTLLVHTPGTVYGRNGLTNFEIPKSVTLIVPHNASSTSVKSAGDNHPYACETLVSGYNSGENHASPYDGNITMEMKVPSGTTITVKGKMAVGGTLDGSGGIASGKDQAKVLLDGSLVVNGSEGNGILSSCGFIYGSGTVRATNNATVYVPFAVDDFRGGGYTVGAAAGFSNDPEFDYKLRDLVNGGELKLMPFNRYSMQAIQCRQVIEYGSKVKAYLDLFAGGEHNTSNITIIGDNNNRGMFNLEASGATATLSYSADQKVSPYGKVGRTNIVLDGATSFYGISIFISAQGVVNVNISTTSIIFPIPYNYNITVNSGTFTLKSPVQLLPGMTLKVNENANLNVDSTLVIYDGFKDYTAASGDVLGTSNRTAVLNMAPYNTQYSGYQMANTSKLYPSTENLMAAGLCGAAEVIVNGTMNINSGAKIGGIIQTTGSNGKIVVNGSAKLSAAAQMGGAGFWQYSIIGQGFAYGLAGATVRTLNAQILHPESGERVDLVNGKTYYSMLKEDSSIDGYNYTLYYAASGVNSGTTYSKDDKKENVTISMQGVWGEYAVEVHEVSNGIASEGFVTEVYMSNADVSDKDYYADVEGTQKVETITESCTVYHIPTFTVTWMNGEEKLGESKVQNGKVPEYPVPEEGEFVEPTKEGYRFIGWALKDDTANAKPLAQLAAVTEDITYYAVFAKEYIITYNTAEDTVWAAEYKAPAAYITGEAVTLPTADNLTREGWTFAGWYANAEYTGDKVTEIAADAAANVTLYARWGQKVDAKAATCVADGNKEYWTDGINKYQDEAMTQLYEGDSWIEKSEGHKYADAVVTFSEDGTTYTVTVTCTVCAEGVEGHTKTSESLNSTETDSTAGDCKTASTKTYEAKGDFEGVTYEETKAVEGANGDHSWQDATCAAPKTCSICDATEGDKLAHTYGEPAFAWDAKVESATCKATFTCTACAEGVDGHEVTVDCSNVTENRTPATCGGSGSVTYTAAVTFNGKEYTSTSDPVTIDPTGDHTYSIPEKDETHHWNKCSCGATDEKKPHADEIIQDHKCDTCAYVMSQCDFSVKGDVVKEANCMTQAVYKAVCATCGEVSDTVTITGDVDSSKHDYSTEWTTDGTDHWHVCENKCSEVSDKGSHTGGTATCTEQAECATCGAEYGELVKHVDADEDGDHICDNCISTEKLNECADGNSDHNCDECTAKLTDHNYEGGSCTICGADDPDVVTGVIVSGTAVSWNGTDDAIYMLYNGTVEDTTIKAEWAAEEPEYTALYTATKGDITDATVDSKAMKSQTFTFEGVAAGAYKLVILKPGKYVPKIVEITVGDATVDMGQQKLWLYGDVTYDGNVNSTDVLHINRYAANLTSMFAKGDEQEQADRFAAANVTAINSNDSAVNSTDVLHINRYAANLTSAFDKMN